MQIRIGYELNYECPQPTRMILVLNVHHSRVSDFIIPDPLHTDPHTDPPLPITPYCSNFDPRGFMRTFARRS
jgi:hypothetical protein